MKNGDDDDGYSEVVFGAGVELSEEKNRTYTRQILNDYKGKHWKREKKTNK